MGIYAAVSKRVMEILGRFSPTIEPLSLDEAFLDGNGTEALFGTPVEMAWKIQQAVKAELELSCAVRRTPREDTTVGRDMWAWRF